MDARAANDRIAEKAAQYRFHSRVPMLCECTTPECRAVVMIALDEYRAIRRDGDTFLTAPGHDVDRAELHRATPDYDVHHARWTRGEGNGDRRSA